MTRNGKPSPARIAAAQALHVIAADTEVLAANALASATAQENLSPEDARLARTLVYGVLRTSLTVDYLYGRFLSRRPESLSAHARLLLRLASFQHYYLSRVPGYALVNDALEIGRQAFKLPQREIGFLNAVLRKLVADTEAFEALPQGNRASALSVRYSFPVEIVRLLVEKYGGLRAAEIMEACNNEPPLTLRTNLLKNTPGELITQLETEGFAVHSGHLAPEALIVGSTAAGKSLFGTAAFREGRFYVQDEGSQMVAHIALPWAKGRVLDLCAAPGGKTTHLAELTGGQSSITATDSSERRLELVRQNLVRLGTPGVVVEPLDQVVNRLYDLVLVDAPCSGLGTMRRNPEIRYRLTAENLERHQERQLAVLTNAAKLVAPGGALVYSTCSVSNAENRDVVKRFMLKQRVFTSLDGPPPNPHETLATPKLARHDEAQILSEKFLSHYSTWPHWPSVDGFEATVFFHGKSDNKKRPFRLEAAAPR